MAKTTAQQAATGLQQFDTSQGTTSINFDHLPLVVDFRIFDFAESDFNFSRTVDAADLAIWQTGYGTASGATRLMGDANGDGDVDGRDFLVWQRGETTDPFSATELEQWQSAYNGGQLAALTTVPEPGSIMLTWLAVLFSVATRKRFGR